MNEQLKKLQSDLLSMMIKLDEFLSKQKLDYFLIGGSALGAVRHEGFIPWDDDIDIALFRGDFERFERAAEGLKQYGLLYEKVEGHSFPEAPIGFLYDVSDPDKKLWDCPCIDIFPIDGIPEGKIKQKRIELFAYLYHISVYRRPAKNRGKLMKVLTTVFSALTPDKLFDFYMQLAKKEITKYPPESHKLVANIFGMKGFKREIMPKEYFGSPVRVPFESRMFPIPEKSHEYLTHLFGDYKELPPEEERRPHHISIDYEAEEIQCPE